MTVKVWNTVVLVAGYSLAIGLGYALIGSIVDRLWSRFTPGLARLSPLPAIVGSLEVILYISAWLLDGKEFIAIWLALKFIGDWTPTKTDTDRPLHHIFLIGNALNVILSVGFALLIDRLLRP